MAQRVVFVDDLDGSDAEGTIMFAIDEIAYDIDLSEEHATELRDFLAKYVAAGRRRKEIPPRPVRGTAVKADTEVAEARAWLVANGHKVPDRGRIKQDLLDIWRMNKDQADPEDPEELEEPEEELEGDEEAGEEEPAEVDPSDEAIMAWWQSQGYKPAGKVNPLMRAQYKRAKGVAS